MTNSKQAVKKNDNVNNEGQAILAMPIEESCLPDSTNNNASKISLGKVKQSPLLRSFVSNLPTYFSVQELKHKFRHVKDGIFVDISLYDRLIKHLAEFKAKETETALQVDERFEQMLFGSHYSNQFYLLEGKICLVGYLIILSDRMETISKVIPEFRGSLIDASQQLHPRDPLLLNITNVETVLDRNGFSLSIKLGADKLLIDTQGLLDFQQLFLTNVRKRARNNTIIRSLRDCLAPMIKLLRGANPVRQQDLLLIASQYRTEKNVRFYRSGGIVFVIVNNQLKSVYNLRGRNLLNFIDQELDALRSQKRYRIADVVLSKKNGPILGSLQTADSETCLVHMHMLLRLLELAMRKRVLRKQLKARFTVFDLILLLSKLMSATVRIEAREVPYAVLKSYINLQIRKQSSKIDRQKKIKPSRFRKNKNNKYDKWPSSNTVSEELKYRSGGGWIFFIHDQRVLRSMMERK